MHFCPASCHPTTRWLCSTYYPSGWIRFLYGWWCHLITGGFSYTLPQWLSPLVAKHIWGTSSVVGEKSWSHLTLPDFVLVTLSRHPVWDRLPFFCTIYHCHTHTLLTTKDAQEDFSLTFLVPDMICKAFKPLKTPDQVYWKSPI